MGYYDGLGGVTDTASAWQLADTLELPALLVVRPKGASLTLAASCAGCWRSARGTYRGHFAQRLQ